MRLWVKLTVAAIATHAVIDQAALADVAATNGGAPATRLEEEFRDPPAEARPRVWWHWLNGNISKDGITKDLEWMKRTGIAGVQTFDINFQTPDVIDRPLSYMTPEWKDAFRFAAQETDRLGLELTVASSPGWSLTGGPWVRPEDGIKKVVWSETFVSGDDHGAIMLALPPTVSGPFQDIALNPEPGADPDHRPPELYRDIRVLAYRAAPPHALPQPGYALHDDSPLDAKLLTDGNLVESVRIGRDTDGGAGIAIEYDEPQMVRSLVAHFPGAADQFAGPRLEMILEYAAADDNWREVARFRPTVVPSTIAFDPVMARRFRLRMIPLKSLSPIDLMSAPGYAGINYSLYLDKMPIQAAELRLLAEPRLDQFEAKAGYGIVRDYYALESSMEPGEKGIAADGIVDLSRHLRENGTLDWTPPQGHWRVLRLGWSLTGKTNHPAPADATGLEVDKLDAGAVRRYMETYLANYRAAVGPDLIGKRGINAILTDSTEVGTFNWTPGLIAEFARLRGYDPTRWLPTLTGVIVGTREQSDRFLYDFRRTIAQLQAAHHYGTVANVAHEAGLQVYGEALEGWRVSLGDDIDMRHYTDIPMAAMWAFPDGTGPRPLLVADLRTAASSAHLRGKTIVAAESMTSSRFPWAMGPNELRRVVDTEFAHGINRIIIHTSPHQPVDDKRPGLSLRHIGQFFTRHETWAGMAKPWIDYIARSSHLLQQGRFVADVAYFAGEEAPVPTLAAEERLSGLPTRFGYDFVNASALLDDLSVEDGEIVSKGGARYRVLYLGGTSKRMTLPVLRAIHRLVDEGATVVGIAPQSTPSLSDDPKEFARLVRKLWRGGNAAEVGRGRVIACDDVEAALASLGIAPDLTPGEGADGVNFVHRALADGDIYFLQNSTDAPRSFEARFRVTGKAPDRWDAVTGRTSPLSYRMSTSDTAVRLEMKPHGSQFIVFRRPAEKARLDVSSMVLEQDAQIDGPWQVGFETEKGAPSGTTFERLESLSLNDEPGIRYFSGVATYTARFPASAKLATDRTVSLDLGAVGDIAEVRINGKLAGTIWESPYRLDIGGMLQVGANVIEVKVANLWVNRLIGDAQPNAEKAAFTVFDAYRADAPLRPSGLMGPVTILSDASQ